MKNPLRRGLAALTLTAATLTGTALATTTAEATTADTSWGSVAVDPITLPAPVTDLVVTPLDTTWG